MRFLECGCAICINAAGSFLYSHFLEFLLELSQAIMGEEFTVVEVSSVIKKRERETYGEAVDGDEVVTVEHFADSINIAGQL